METTDLELLRTYAGGDEAAFEQLARRHAAWMFAAARRRLRDDHLADDATQSVLVLLAGKAEEVIGKGRDSISGWLFRVLHFACLHVRRTRSRQERIEERAGAARESVGHPEGELRMLLEDSIAQLPAEDREAVVRRFYRGEDWASIGAALGVSAEAARKRVGRAVVALKAVMLRDRVEVIPDEFLAGMESGEAERVVRGVRDKERIDSIGKGALAMAEQEQAVEFPVMTAEFVVKDVEANLEFFEKLGFRRRWAETPDPMGRLPRASLVGGVGRIWLRRAEETEGTRPMPGVVIYFWIEGGAEGLAKHRSEIAGRGVEVSPYCDDHSLRNFTATTPDGYRVGFFAQYR